MSPAGTQVFNTCAFEGHSTLNLGIEEAVRRRM